jgi:alkylation response protein AidB-like acyl-CoA dehydrogenase
MAGTSSARVTDSSSLEAFRTEVRAWISAADAPSEPEDLDQRIPALLGWQRTLLDAGLVGVHWPVEYGGRGLSPLHAAVIASELARAGVPGPVSGVGLDVVGPTLIRYGSPEQREAHLHRILSGEEVWCLGYSEPGAGSDLAAVQTTAVKDGDDYIINGQKVWTSFAAHAQQIAVIARTDPKVAKHKGLSFLLVDMATPGLTVRPVVQMTGDTEFCEVFFDQVRVPRSALVGGPGDGWAVTLGSLANERGPFMLRRFAELGVWASEFFQSVATSQSPKDFEQDVAELAVVMDTLEAITTVTADRMARDSHTLDQGSIDKLLCSTLEQAMFHIANRVLGRTRTGTGVGRANLDPTRWTYGYLYSRAAPIYAGTDQVQKNIIAQRILGLPKEANA